MPQPDTAGLVLAKARTGIAGLDEVTFGGLPVGRSTLVCGGAGCGKTLLAMQFLINGMQDFGEPGVFVAFEESGSDLASNMASLGVDLRHLIAERKLLIDQVSFGDEEITDSGDFSLEGLFIRLGHAIDSIGARRVALDTLETLFVNLPNENLLRRDLRRLFEWLKNKGVTTIITAERGERTLTRYGIEEYVSDCVIVLDHRVIEQMSTRRLRVLKYRGSTHGTNEYPFLIDTHGISVLPVTSAGLEHVASQERISSGVSRLDEMLDGKGFFRGSSVLISGTAGCGKTSIAAHFVNAACERGERCLMFLFEESPSQLMRNMTSIGIHLAPWAERGLLQFHPARPSLYGLEMHLAIMQKMVENFSPSVVVIDPISSFGALGNVLEIRSMLVRLVDFLKLKNITALVTSLSNPGLSLEHTEQEISSLIDTWLLLRDIESSGERNRGMYILKSRGMAHSNQIREFVLTDQGIRLADVYVGAAGVLTGAARQAQEAREKAEQLQSHQEIERQTYALERKRQAMTSRIAALEAEFAAEEAEARRLIEQERQREQRLLQDKADMLVKRGIRT